MDFQESMFLLMRDIDDGYLDTGKHTKCKIIKKRGGINRKHKRKSGFNKIKKQLMKGSDKH